MNYLITGPSEFLRKAAIFINEYDIEPWEKRLFGDGTSNFAVAVIWQNNTWSRTFNEQNLAKYKNDSIFSHILIENEDHLKQFQAIFVANTSYAYLYNLDDIYKYNGM